MKMVRPSEGNPGTASPQMAEGKEIAAVPPIVWTLLHFAKGQHQTLLFGFAGFQIACCLAVLLINLKNMRVWKSLRHATPGDQFTHIRTVVRRLLAMNALVLSVTAGLLIYDFGLHDRFSGLIGTKLVMACEHSHFGIDWQLCIRIDEESSRTRPHILG
jgi:hypothetical protein